MSVGRARKVLRLRSILASLRQQGFATALLRQSSLCPNPSGTKHACRIHPANADRISVFDGHRIPASKEYHGVPPPIAMDLHDLPAHLTTTSPRELPATGRRIFVAWHRGRALT